MTGSDRFLDKAEKYEKYRPTYNKETLSIILKECNILPNSDILVADIGCGTGKFTELLLDNGFKVYGIDPNDNMRAIAELKFKDNNNFKSIAATSENTKLEDNSVDLITAAQSFHYFDFEKVKKEFLRVLKPSGKVVLLWNFKLRDSEFIKDYENAIYTFHSKKVKPTHAQDNMKDELFKKFFSEYKIINIPNSQEFNLDGLWGRTLSNNHAPQENEPEYSELYRRVKEIFDKYQRNNTVLFPYRTQIVIGKVKK